LVISGKFRTIAFRPLKINLPKNENAHNSKHILLSWFFLIVWQSAESQSVLNSPEKHFGFIPGSDYNLFTYEELIDYLMKLDKASPMVKMEEIGVSPMGRKMYLVFISSEKNINNLPRLREINRELALNPSLAEARRKEYISEGKVFFLATLSMHSTEVAPSQAAPLIAYQLVTTGDPLIKKYLDDVVYMMVPTIILTVWTWWWRTTGNIRALNTRVPHCHRFITSMWVTTTIAISSALRRRIPGP
jgi:hypothetical protein